jgi:hypothetical protein
MIDVHAMQCGIWAELAAEDPDLGNGRTPDTHAQAPASSEAGQFIPQFIPIAERDGIMLVCDTRPGRLLGCITEFGKDTADGYPPTWASLSAMLADHQQHHHRRIVQQPAPTRTRPRRAALDTLFDTTPALLTRVAEVGRIRNCHQPWRIAIRRLLALRNRP